MSDLIAVNGNEGTITMDYEFARNMVDEEGWDEWVNFIAVTFPTYKIYNCSQGWYDDGRQYICKAKGERGDVLVLWNK